jgi:hypothetical protein
MKLFLLGVGVAGVLAAAPHWDIQYRYQQTDSTLTLNAIAFPAAQRGVVCGYTTDRRGNNKPFVLTTSDGGMQWNEAAFRETGVALFFLDEGNGWMATDRGVWYTSEAGRAWNKLVNAPSGILKVWFVDRNHGFAVGTRKRVFETRDGGDNWTLLPIVSEVQGDPQFSSFGEITFSEKNGIISGWNITPRTKPADKGEALPQIPRLTTLLETRDGGTTWKKNEVSLFGQITQISLTPQGTGLGLIEFTDDFDYPSEVYRINLRNGRSERVLRRKDHAVTAVRLFAGSNTAIAAGYETSGPVFRSVVPGKLRVMTTIDYENWTDMEVDARAVAHKAMIAGPDENSLWIATDTGSILHLVN